MISSRKVLSVAFTAALIGGAGLGSAGVAVASTGPAAQSLPAMTTERMSISIEGFEYSGPGTINPGGVITVTNNDSEAHTVTADDGSFDITIPGGTSATFTAPSQAGAYGYFCKFHSNMKGTLTVGAEVMAPSAPAPETEAPTSEAGESGSAGSRTGGMDQMGAVPKGGADTGVPAESTSEESKFLALGGGLVLLAAVGGTYAVRRRGTDS